MFKEYVRQDEYIITAITFRSISRFRRYDCGDDCRRKKLTNVAN